MLVGYARVSTSDQDPRLQLDALKEAGCEKIFKDTKSGATAKRPGLSKALNFVRKKDTLVVWRLDRLGRSLKDLLEIVQTLGRSEDWTEESDRVPGHHHSWWKIDFSYLRVHCRV